MPVIYKYTGAAETYHVLVMLARCRPLAHRTLYRVSDGAAIISQLNDNEKERKPVSEVIFVAVDGGGKMDTQHWRIACMKQASLT